MPLGASPRSGQSRRLDAINPLSKRSPMTKDAAPARPGVEKLTKAQRAALRFIIAEGPGTLPLTKEGRVTVAVAGLVDAGHLELLNRLRPGPPMYEITPAGRQALDQKP